MTKIALIGGGFSGTMCAVQLIHQSTEPIEILLFNEKASLNRGVAYLPYSNKHLLNVVVSKMSAFPAAHDHFLNWVLPLKEYQNIEKSLIANSFLPRRVYGDYLSYIWKEATQLANDKQIKLSIYEDQVSELTIEKNLVSITCENEQTQHVDYCIIATGNHIPSNPRITNTAFYKSPFYFGNPWKIDSVSALKSDLPVLIIGNGLTMVDTVLGLLENGFKGEIFSISPNGFNILPHRHTGQQYTALNDEIENQRSLLDIVKLVNKHIKTVRQLGMSAEPVIDALRPHTQRIWQGLSTHEKKIFMARLRHLWGVARHRIPLHTYDKIQQLRIDDKLHIISGKIQDMNVSDGSVNVDYLDRKDNKIVQRIFARVINCTGPETAIDRMEGHFLKKCLEKGILFQDELKLGIRTNTETFEILKPTGEVQNRLFTIGSTLKGELWESTAVNELREQAERLADQILLK